MDQIVNMVKPAVHSDKCFPGKDVLCDGGVVNEFTWDVFSLNDIDKNLTLPNVTLLYDHLPASDIMCQTGKNDKYINTTDNTLLCKKEIFIKENLLSRTILNQAKDDSTHGKMISERIPIF